MPRALFLGILFLAGCRLADREALQPIPENAPPLKFEEMLSRARVQASTALDAFYVDAWPDLEQAAQRLEQTALLLPKTTQIPDPLKTKIAAEADLMHRDAAALTEAARAKNATQANE